jgi:hypothetical protein
VNWIKRIRQEINEERAAEQSRKATQAKIASENLRLAKIEVPQYAREFPVSYIQPLFDDLRQARYRVDGPKLGHYYPIWQTAIERKEKWLLRYTGQKKREYFPPMGDYERGESIIYYLHHQLSWYWGIKNLGAIYVVFGWSNYGGDEIGLPKAICYVVDFTSRVIRSDLGEEIWNSAKGYEVIYTKLQSHLADWVRRNMRSRC